MDELSAEKLIVSPIPMRQEISQHGALSIPFLSGKKGLIDITSLSLFGFEPIDYLYSSIANALLF